MTVQWVLGALLFAGPLVAAVAAHRAGAVTEARARASLGALVALLAAMALALTAGSFAELSPFERLRAGLPVFVSVIGVSAIAMTPARGASPAIFSAALTLLAASLALVRGESTLEVTLFFALEVLIVALAMRGSSATRPASRSLSLYLGVSALLVLLSAALEEARPGLALAALLLGLGVRESVFPFHGWLPRFFDKAPLTLVVMFVAPQLGVYLHLRALSQGFDAGFEGVVAGLSGATALLAAVMGVAQERPRRALGYLMVSQTSFVATGLSAHSAEGYAGALASWFVSGLSLAGMIMALAAVEARRGELSLDTPSGSFERMPRLAASFLLLGLSGVGAPLTFGFVAGELLLEGASGAFPLLGLVLIFATAVNAISVLRSFFALFTGEPARGAPQDLSLRERLGVGLLLLALFSSGIFPAAMVRFFERDAAEDTQFIEAKPTGNLRAVP